MTHLAVQSSVAKTATFTGSGVSVSGITGDWTLKIHVSTLTAGSLARLSFEDTLNDYTASLAGPTLAFLGDIEISADKVKSFKKQDFPDLRLGQSGAQLRLKLARLDAATTVTYDAWLEY